VSIDLTQRLMDATVGTLELYAVHLGRRLGLYDALDRHGPQTAAGLAERTGIHPRYAREWLEQQAVAGYLTVTPDGPAGTTATTATTGTTGAAGRRFELPAEHRGALVDPLDGDHLAPFAGMVVGIANALDEVVEAYRSGDGVPYASYGPDFRAGQGGINRPAFTTDLVKSWLPAVDGAVARLDAGARVVDLGTGHGWSAIAVKATWPGAEVIGLDTDTASIAEARRHAEQAGVDVRFAVPGAAAPEGAEPGDQGPVDLVLVLEALHDMADPAGVLAAARAALAPGGLVVIADEAVAEAFAAPGDDLERMMYGWSVSHCLPAAMAEQPSAALGTVLRPATVADLAREAGFGRCDVVDVDAGFFRLYRLAA
jgi:2-polyprenyl-3-methyl-5-hydroxy-6-metoxy-1,4-benzoquinol methylase